MGFLKFVIIATLMVACFPWSLGFCLLVMGMQDTKLLIVALLHNGVRIICAALLITILIVVIMALSDILFVT